MRRRAESFLRRAWMGGAGWPGRLVIALASPLSGAWVVATAVRNRRHGRAGARVPGLAVVSVGNLAVGGTGKTPLTAWVASTLRASGRSPAVIVSGYGRDERLLHARWSPDIPVLADRDRVAAARRARARGADVAVLDDGFQHRRLARDLDLVLLAVEDAFPGRALPAGPYREGARALSRADLAVVTRRTGTLEAARRLAKVVASRHPGLATAGVHLVADRLVDLDGTPTPVALDDVLAVAAIGRPEAFGAAVRARARGAVELASFSDHHEYTERDVAALRRRAGARPIVTTEKDAVKLASHRDALGSAYVLVGRVAWDWGEGAVSAALDAATRSVTS